MKQKNYIEELKAEIKALDKEIEKMKYECFEKESLMYDKGYKQCLKDVKEKLVYKGD